MLERIEALADNPDLDITALEKVPALPLRFTREDREAIHKLLTSVNALRMQMALAISVASLLTVDDLQKLVKVDNTDLSILQNLLDGNIIARIEDLESRVTALEAP